MNSARLARDEELLDRTRAERAADRVVRPFQLFARRQASGAVVLLVCAILALAWVNSPWAWSYEQMLGVPLGISIGEQSLRLDLRHWINDGLMAIFFFGVGLEIKSRHGHPFFDARHLTAHCQQHRGFNEPEGVTGVDRLVTGHPEHRLKRSDIGIR